MDVVNMSLSMVIHSSSHVGNTAGCTCRYEGADWYCCGQRQKKARPWETVWNGSALYR
jgi:hypothetical protein